MVVAASASVRTIIATFLFVVALMDLTILYVELSVILGATVGTAVIIACIAAPVG